MPIVPMFVPIASVGIVIPTVIVSILLGLVAGLAVLFIAIARTRSGGSVPADDRLMTAMGHLSGYGGYVIPIGGVLIPILLIMTAEDGGTVKAAAKQALALNVFVYIMAVGLIALWFTIVLIPLAWAITAASSASSRSSCPRSARSRRRTAASASTLVGGMATARRPALRTGSRGTAPGPC